MLSRLQQQQQRLTFVNGFPEGFKNTLSELFLASPPPLSALRYLRPIGIYLGPVRDLFSGSLFSTFPFSRELMLLLSRETLFYTGRNECSILRSYGKNVSRNRYKMDLGKVE